MINSVVPWNFFLLPSLVAQHENPFSTNEVFSEKNDCLELTGINTYNFIAAIGPPGESVLQQK